MDETIRSVLLIKPFALETLLVLATEVGTDHGTLANYFGHNESTEAKDLLESNGLARHSDLMESVTSKGERVAQELREMAGIKSPVKFGADRAQYIAEAEAIRQAIPRS